jgi:hypothetical protein
MPGTFDKIATEIGRSLLPLKAATEDIDAFQGLLLKLGWTSEDIPQPIKDLLSKAEKIETQLTAIADGDVSQLTDFFTSLLDLVNAIEDLKTKPFDPILAAQDFASRFPVQLVDYLIIEYLDSYHARLAFALKMLGVITSTYMPAEGARPAYMKRTLSFKDLPKLVKDPVLIFQNAYGWRTADFDYRTILGYIQRLTRSFHLMPYFEPLNADEVNVFDTTDSEGKFVRWALNVPVFVLVTETTEESFGFRFYGLPEQGASLPGLAVLPYLNADAAKEFEITDRLKLKIESTLTAEGNLALTLRPEEGFTLFKGLQNPGSASPTQGTFIVSLTNSNTDSTPVLVLGSSEGSRLEYKSLSFKAGAILEPGKTANVFIELSVEDALLTVKNDGGDGFLNKIIGDGFSANFSFAIGLSSLSGFYFRGSSGLQLQIPAHIDLGILEIQGLTIAIKPKDDTIPVELGADIKTSLGPVTAIIQNIGLSAKFSFPGNNTGNIGPLDLALGFKPPNGVGLSIDAGGIKGGGFLKLDPDNGEYFGSMELEFKDLFSLKAYGIINTKLPDGSKGFSLLIVITAEFTPIQLGFGFTLNGVGGLLGVNRTVKVDVLKEGIKTNTLKSILFPEDVVANIDRIISDIKQIFPPQNEHFLLAPMAKIGWGTPTLITLEMGLLIEIPSSRLIILGVLKALLPEEDKPLLKLQVNFIGELDFENKTISFDAVLYDSSLLTFTLSGQMALRISWGDQKVFVLSVGGFHPAFKEIPKGLEQMQRLTISLINQSDLRLTIQNYFAVTSNTVQFGAKAELYASNGGSWNIYGYVGYDVLFQFDPFQFMADFKAGLALRRNESVIMGISVSGSLHGPSPWNAKGEASVSFFFFSISIPFNKSWGENAEPVTTDNIDVIKILTDLINDKRSWSAVIPTNKNLHVTIKPITEKADILTIHPFGILTFSERFVPLGIDIDKVGTKQPKDAKKFVLKVTDEDLKAEPVREQFAPANFKEMSDSDKLASPSFESLESGFQITGSQSLAAPMLINKSVTYEFSYLGREKKPVKDRYRFEKLLFNRNMSGGVIATSALSYSNKRVSLNAPEKVAVENERFVIAHTSNMQLFNEKSIVGSYTEAVQYYNELVTGNPALKDQIQVLSAFELTPN